MTNDCLGPWLDHCGSKRWQSDRPCRYWRGYARRRWFVEVYVGYFDRGIAAERAVRYGRRPSSGSATQSQQRLVHIDDDFVDERSNDALSQCGIRSGQSFSSRVARSRKSSRVGETTCSSPAGVSQYIVAIAGITDRQLMTAPPAAQEPSQQCLARAC